MIIVRLGTRHIPRRQTSQPSLKFRLVQLNV